MLKALVAGVISFGMIIYAMLFIIVPFVFNLVTGLFNNSDLGTAIAIAVILLCASTAFGIALLLSIGIAALIGVLFDGK